MNKTNKTNNKNKKEELSPLYKKLSLGPEIRAEEPKGVYPKGRVKQVFAVMSGEMNSLMRVNAWFLLFAIPLFFVLYWCSNYFTSLATSKFDFMGNVGMAFPGGGHPATGADCRIRRVADRVLSACPRNHDYVYRYGGRVQLSESLYVGRKG